MRLLLVIADTGPLKVCADFFSARGCVVDAIADPVAAERILHRGAYDAVITDDDEVSELASGMTRDVRTILLTTNADSRPLTFTKPVPLQQLFDAIHAG